MIRKILCYFGKHAGHLYTGRELNLEGLYRVCAYCGDVKNLEDFSGNEKC